MTRKKKTEEARRAARNLLHAAEEIAALVSCDKLDSLDAEMQIQDAQEALAELEKSLGV